MSKKTTDPDRQSAMRATEKPVKLQRKQSRRGDLTERLIKILLLLAEGRRTQSELARLCGVNNVTIRRNITELIRHYFIVAELRGGEDHGLRRPLREVWLHAARKSARRIAENSS